MGNLRLPARSSPFSIEAKKQIGCNYAPYLFLVETKGLAPFALRFRSKKVEIPCKRGIYISLVFNFRCSLSRRGSKRPFHRSFSRKVLIKRKSLSYFATSCPFEPLFNRSKKTNRVQLRTLFVFWWKRRGSNPRPLACEASALTN